MVRYCALLLLLCGEHTTVTNEARQCPDMESFVFIMMVTVGLQHVCQKIGSNSSHFIVKIYSSFNLYVCELYNTDPGGSKVSC